MKDSEILIKRYLESLEYVVQRYNKEELNTFGNKTPDFKVYKESVLLFFCEVKEIEEDKRLYVDGSENDNIYGKISNKILESSLQFVSVNENHELPNVLVIYSKRLEMNIKDYIFVYTGNFYSDENETIPLFKNISNGKIKGIKSNIDLCVWYDESKDNFKFAFSKDSVHFHNLCSYFRRSEEDINEYKY